MSSQPNKSAKPTKQATSNEITRDEWIDAWRAAMEEHKARTGDEGMTSEELADALQIPTSAIDRRLRRLFQDGRLITGRSNRLRRDGVMSPVPVYRIK